MVQLPLSRRTLLAYGAPALPAAMLGLPLLVYLPSFYAQTVGLGLTSVGAILLLARLWDVVTDPLVGLLSDRTRSRIGRRRQGVDGFVLEEEFVYADGEKQRRVWRIRQTAPGVHEGQADEVIGTSQGQSSGNALNWRYVLALKIGETNWNVDFNDWMFLQPDGVLLNRARISKWGIAIGEVTLSFQRGGAAKAAMSEASAVFVTAH